MGTIVGGFVVSSRTVVRSPCSDRCSMANSAAADGAAVAWTLAAAAGSVGGAAALAFGLIVMPGNRTPSPARVTSNARSVAVR